MQNSARLPLTLIGIFMLTWQIVGCQSDVLDAPSNDADGNASSIVEGEQGTQLPDSENPDVETDQSDSEPTAPSEPGTGSASSNGQGSGSAEQPETDDQNGSGQPEPEVENDHFELATSSTSVSITEGLGWVDIPLNVTRKNGHEGDLRLTVADTNSLDDGFFLQQFTDSLLGADEDESILRVNVLIGPKPIQPHTRRLVIRADDDAGNVSSVELLLQVTPTDAPDVYLLIGQSNMVGISELDARRAQPGQPDAPVQAVRQLNVTFNDTSNFGTASDFTSEPKLLNINQPFTVALDPLHSGMQSDGNKEGTRVGLGLSFGKSAMQNTTAEIYLVPAAWSDTGFCRRESAALPGIGWNATPKNNPVLGGTLLHDRAIARANAALSRSGGILRGILWHQGEADSDAIACAESYAENLTEMIRSLRSNIAVDARGPVARGPDADIPFIVGTMSKGGGQAPFSDTKLIVDNAHRSVSSLVSYADFVNNDDLVPPAYACGGGSCIHFGADALREMGARYYEKLISILQ